MNAVIKIYRLMREDIVADFLLKNVAFAANATNQELIQAVMSPDNEDLKLPYSNHLSKTDTSLDLAKLRSIAEGYQLNLSLENLTPEAILFFGPIETPEKWGNFFGPIADNTEQFLNKQNLHHSFLLFIFLNNEIYAMTSGLAYHQIARYIDDMFGVTVVSHFIDTNTTEIRALQNSSLYGSTLLSDRLFANNFKIYNEDSFGKIYRKILASVDQTILKDKLPFIVGKKEKLARNCLGKSHFTIFKSISLNQAILLICQLQEIHKLGMNPVLKISGIRQLKPSNPKSKQDIENFNWLTYDDLLSGASSATFKYDYSILPADSNRYFTANEYTVLFGSEELFSTDNINEISATNIMAALTQSESFLDKVLSAYDSTGGSYEEIEKIFGRITLRTENDNYNPSRIDESLPKVLHCEVPDGGKTYYNLNDRWFSIESNLATQINDDLGDLVRGIEAPYTLLPWKKAHDEHKYIEQYLTEKDFFPIHTITHNSKCMELADLIRVSGNEIDFIHIKDGFDHKIRELSSQVTTSTQILNEDIKSNNSSWLKEIYQEIAGITPSSGYLGRLKTKFLTRWPTENSFIKYVSKSKIRFCMAFSGNSNNHALKSHPEKYRSLIAKMSLLSGEKHFGTIKGRNWELRVIQLLNSP